MTRLVVVTGGAGFIGANLAAHYLDQGERVAVYDTLDRNGGRENLDWLQGHPRADNLALLIGDIGLPTRPFQAVFHLAGQVAVTTSVAEPDYDFEVNAVGPFELLEPVRQSQRSNLPRPGLPEAIHQVTVLTGGGAGLAASEVVNRGHLAGGPTPAGAAGPPRRCCACSAAI